ARWREGTCAPGTLPGLSGVLDGADLPSFAGVKPSANSCVVRRVDNAYALSSAGSRGAHRFGGRKKIADRPTIRIGLIRGMVTRMRCVPRRVRRVDNATRCPPQGALACTASAGGKTPRSEEHTSE